MTVATGKGLSLGSEAPMLNAARRICVIRLLRIATVLILSATGLRTGPALAVTSTYTDSTSFLAALPGPAMTETFDGLSAGDPVGTLGNITFSESVPGESLIVTDFYSAPSDPLMLGLTNLDEAFQDGDVLDLVFGTPVNAIGLFVVTSDAALLDEILLGVDGLGVAGNAATEEVILADGGLAYFLGIISDTPFTGATLDFANDGEVNFVYNVDNITTAVPEPSTAVFIAMGLAMLASQRRVAHSRQGD